MRLQAGRRAVAQKSAVIPSDVKRRKVIEDTVREYSCVKQLAPDWIRNGLSKELAFNYFLSCVAALNMDAGSGIPYAFINGRITNDLWFQTPAQLEDLWTLVWERLKRMLHYEWTSPEQAVLDGVTDPVRLFVKGEPHKLAKIQEGRFRLIASVSLVDQLVARMLFQDQNKMELRCFRDIPSQPGMGLSSDQQVEDFVERLAVKAGAPSSEELVANWQEWVVPTDCSGFDWSVPMWLLEDDIEVRNLLTVGITPELSSLRSVWLKCLGNSLLSLSDGCLLAQTTPGIQKSGSYNTSSSNSRIRVMMSKHAGASWCLAMGDDAIESPDTDVGVYKSLGFKCEVAEKFDFCSHVFHSPSVAIPSNVGKMLIGLLCGISPVSSQIQDRITWMISCQSVLQELRHLPLEDLEEIYSALHLEDLTGQKSK